MAHVFSFDAAGVARLRSFEQATTAKRAA